MSDRIDDYEGTLDQYVVYLEQLVVGYRRQLNNDCEPSRMLTTNGEARSTITPVRECSGGGSTAARQPASAHSRTIKFIRYEDGTAMVKRIPAVPARWRQSAAVLLKQAPRASQWYQALRDRGVYDMMSNGKAVAYLIGTQMPFQLSTPPKDEPPNTPQSRLDRYARAAMLVEGHASNALVLMNFQKFIMLSACLVLHKLETGTVIYDIARLCLGKDVTEKRCSDIFQSCRYVNRLLDTIYMKGWELRGCELLLLWNQPPTFFYHLYCASSDSLQYLATKLCTQEFTRLKKSPDPWTSIFVPQIIYSILGGGVTIECISEVLGYRDSHLFRANPWQLQSLP